MMKKILQILCICLVAYTAKAQEQSQHQLFVGNAAVDYKNTANNFHLQMQIGSPVISSLNTGALQARVGFPYGILYIAPTFVVGGFEVSKGYYTNRINIKWQLGANQNVIEKINIYRKELESATPMQLISSVSKDVFEYDDTQTQGGVLYQYKIEAVGVSVIEELYATYIEGVGFRSPTATVSGSISFDGGSPVQDVIVFAEANGADNNSGSSLQFTGAGSANIENIEYDIPTNQLTLQSWLSSAGDIFKFTTQKNKEVKIYAGKSESSKIEFVVSVDGTVIQTAALHNAYPTGKLDPLGNDIFQDIDALTTSSFIHISTVLEDSKAAKFYINGRELTSDYIEAATIREGYKTPNLVATTVADYATLADDKVKRVTLAENYTGYIDEVRIWQRALPAEEIRRDYRRYISGGERGLSIYLRMDEKAGTNVYDFSKKGFRQNKNDAYFSNGVAFSSVTPTSQQLGVFGVTDANGSYIISSIGYSGNGESFVITPSFGVHEFEPASQSLFLGSESSVVNQLNFKDISSFKFSGKAVYNTQDVFNSVAVTKYIDIEDYGYNQYKAIDTDNGNTSVTINKGQYYYQGGTIDTSDNTYTGGELRKYKVIIVENAFVYIDGTIVIGPNNQPVQTTNEGKFTINVPIGDHKVEVRKDGHTFAHSGYFPASDTFEFFEDQIEETWFIDTTRISLVGRVVGGRIESDKPIGFGLNGERSYVNNEGEENAETERISSKNNIGIATIILKGDVETLDLDVSVATDAITGEYKVSLIPYIYHIKPGDLKVPSNPALDGAFLTDNEPVNLLATPVLDSISYTTKDGTELFSEAFHHQKSFRYNSPTTLRLISQEFENEYTIGDNVFDVRELAVPLYLQNSDYSMVFEVTQNYINREGGADNLVETKEYYNEGQFKINNNLTTAADEREQFATQAGVEQYLYTFRASNVNASIDVDFENSIDIQYILANKEPIRIENTADFKDKGVVVGAIEPEGTVFVTVAPEVPDIILRDPPGSNSFASIEQGTTISFQKSNSASEEGSVGGGVYTSLLPTFTSSTGTPFFAAEFSFNTVSTYNADFSKSQQLNQDGSSTETYTFNKTISTSDDPRNVGAGADVYIGNAKNEYYGICNKMVITTAKRRIDGVEVPSVDLNLSNSNKLYLSFQKVHFIAEQPTNTFFIYTQNHIIETLIPSLTVKASNAPPTVATTSDDPEAPGTRQYYMNQVALWQTIIQDNERDKYLALNERATLKTELLAEIARKNAERDQRRSELNDLPFILQRAYTLTEFDTHQAALNVLMTDNFESTISFDAGVGAYTSSAVTSIITAKSYTKTIDLSAEFKTTLGLLINNVGAVASITGTSSSVDETGFSTDMDETTTISYTLKDNDTDNFLAVEVVNLFNGSAPIFITKGGATSCPNEPVTVSEYYEHANFVKDQVGQGGEELNAGTFSVYRPEISLEGVNELTNIPESEGALFMLLLKNMSETETDLKYTIGVDAITLNGATTNIAPNGVVISLPYGETIKFPFEVYKSSTSRTFEYPNIEVYLQSECLDAYASVNVSVGFKPSCSKVAISAPQDNWVFNRAEGYATVTSNDITTITENKLPITFTDFNTDFAGFEKIELQYRNASSANWTKFKTYYGTEDLRDTASDPNGEVIDPDDSEFTFEWNVIGNQVPDGNYELRAISYCTSNVTNVSPIIQGVVNLNAPVLFGTPQPTDGILDVGEDISLRFNEDVYMNGDAANFVEITGLQNQQEIDHSVSVYLDGGANQIELPNQILPKGAFTIQFWYKNATTATGNLISQENGINASLNGDQLTFSVGGASVIAAVSSTQYNFYSLVYQPGANPRLLIFENAVEKGKKELTSDLDIS
jgi:hypothetical protein